MARKPSTRKRREPAPAASTRAEPAASNKRPTTKPGAACLERVLDEGRDAFQPRGAAGGVVRVRGAAGRARRDVEDVRRGGPDAREIGAHDYDDGGPALGVFGEVPRVAAEALNGGRGPAPRRDRGHRRGPREHRARSDRGRALPAAGRAPGVRVVAKGTEDALADCGVLVLDTSKLGPAARARRVVRRLALETTAQQASDGNRLHCELVALAAALDEMGGRTAEALDVPLCQALDLILAVGAAAADVEDGRMTLEAVRRACAAAPRSAAASRQDRASRRSADPRAWFELARRGQAPPFAAAGDDTIEVAHPRLLAALVALKRGAELLAGPKGSYASSRWQKRSFRLPQLYAFEAAGAEARGKYLDALAAVENSE